MADDTPRPPTGYSAVAVHPGPERPGRAVRLAALLLIAGAILGLLGGLIWAAASPRVVYQVATLNPPTAYAVNPETDAFVAADGIYTFIALGGGALLGLGGYLVGVRRFGPLPMAGTVLGGLAAALVASWVGNAATGGLTFNSTLDTSKAGVFLHAPITLGAHGALAFWPVAAALVAGGLELMSFLRAREPRPIGAGGPAPRHGRYPAPGSEPGEPGG